MSGLGNYQIRQLNHDDLATFKAIRLEALERSPLSFASVHADWLHLPDDEWRAQLGKPTVVALISHDPIGIMTVSPRTQQRTAHRGTLSSVYVREEWRSTGVAGALLSELEKIAATMHINQLELSLSGENQRALRFYERCGFVHVGIIPNGYSGDTSFADEIIMLKRLQPHQA